MNDTTPAYPTPTFDADGHCSVTHFVLSDAGDGYSVTVRPEHADGLDRLESAGWMRDLDCGEFLYPFSAIDDLCDVLRRQGYTFRWEPAT